MRICNVWSSIRSLIRDLTFYQIKDLAGLVGLPVYKIGHLQQAPGGASKGQLMDALDDLYKEFDEEDQNRIVTSTIAELIRVTPSSQPQIEDILARFGWGISDGQIHPLSLQIDLETARASSTCT